MSTLNQLKIGETVYDLAAKFDAEDNNIKDTYSTKEYVTQKISELVNSAPGTLDTLNEIAAALNNDSNFATTIITQLGTKVDKVKGKQLSTEDFTAALKTSLESLPGEISDKYVKPSEGIPKTDLSSEVQTSLNKADSAIQDISSKVDNSTYTEDKKTFALKTEIPTTLPASDVSAWAKESVKPTYTATEIGLDQVNNTSDMNKPISTATQAALDGKVDKVQGKQLSTNDYSDEEKSTVAQLKADVEQLKSTVATLTTSLQELKAKA